MLVQQTASVPNEKLEFRDRHSHSSPTTIHHQAKALDTTIVRLHHFGHLRRKVLFGHDGHVVLLEVGEMMTIMAHQNEIIDVDLVTGTV
jgi:hypothetical protein